MKETLDRQKTILQATYFTIISLLVILAAIIILAFLENRNYNQINEAHRLNYLLYEYFELIQNAETGQRGYIITNNEAYLEPYNEAIAKMARKEEEIIDHLLIDTITTKDIQKLFILQDEKLEELAYTIQLKKNDNSEDALRIINSDVGNVNLEKIRDLITSLRIHHSGKIEQLRKKYRVFRTFIFILFSLAMIIGVLNFFTLKQQLDPLLVKLRQNNTKLEHLNKGKSNEIAFRKKVEIKNKQLLQNLQKKNKELNHFAYIASHDLQEPLRTIKNFIQLFEEEYSDQFDEDAQSYFNFIEGASDRMSNLIKGLLQYSKIGSSGVISDIEVREVLTAVSANLNSLLKEKEVALIIPESLPCIKGFRIELIQLFQNLIQNGIKFCTEKPKIIIDHSETAEFHKFSITDNGIGIPEDKIDKIFNMFSRLHSNTKFEGQGIGLAFCKKIVELHQGDIQVESEEGIGTTFIFTISKNLEHVSEVG